MIPAIEALALKKSYTRRLKEPGLLGAVKGLFTGKSIEIPAVKGLDFSIKQGEAVGLIGENGAGKSTTVKMLTGILTPELRARSRSWAWTPRQGAPKSWPSRSAWSSARGPSCSGTSPCARPLICCGPCTRSPIATYQVTRKKTIDLLELEPPLGHPRAAAEPGTAHALRPGRGRAARAQGGLPGRAHHRPGRGGQGTGARADPLHEPPLWNGHPPHHPRRQRHHRDLPAGGAAGQGRPAL